MRTLTKGTLKLVIGVVVTLYKNKKMAEEIKFLREQINKKNFIIRSLLSLRLSNREEDNLSYRIKKKYQ